MFRCHEYFAGFSQKSSLNTLIFPMFPVWLRKVSMICFIRFFPVPAQFEWNRYSPVQRLFSGQASN